jgi:hypothetical protein
VAERDSEQYHPELQPIEMRWGIVKKYMAEHCDFTIQKLRNNFRTFDLWKIVTEPLLMISYNSLILSQ